MWVALGYWFNLLEGGRTNTFPSLSRLLLSIGFSKSWKVYMVKITLYDGTQVGQKSMGVNGRIEKYNIINSLCCIFVKYIVSCNFINWIVQDFNCESEERQFCISSLEWVLTIKRCSLSEILMSWLKWVLVELLYLEISMSWLKQGSSKIDTRFID